MHLEVSPIIVRNPGNKKFKDRPSIVLSATLDIVYTPSTSHFSIMTQTNGIVICVADRKTLKSNLLKTRGSSRGIFKRNEGDNKRVTLYGVDDSASSFHKYGIKDWIDPCQDSPCRKTISLPYGGKTTIKGWEGDHIFYFPFEEADGKYTVSDVGSILKDLLNRYADDNLVRDPQQGLMFTEQDQVSEKEKTYTLSHHALIEICRKIKCNEIIIRDGELYGKFSPLEGEVK